MKREKISGWGLMIAGMGLLVGMANFALAQTPQTIVDLSDNPFIVRPAYVHVIFPSGDEDWNAGSEHRITWSLSSKLANVNIDYSTDKGQTWTPVVAAANCGELSLIENLTPSTDSEKS